MQRDSVIRSRDRANSCRQCWPNHDSHPPDLIIAEAEDSADVHDMMPWALAAASAAAQQRQRPVPVATFDSSRRSSILAAMCSLTLCTSSLLPPPAPFRRYALFGAASAGAAPPSLSAAQPLSLEQAVEQVLASCDPAFLSAVRQSGRFLYRGESSILPPRGADAGNDGTTAAALLCPPPDLLIAGTYGEDDSEALAYFKSLERTTLAGSPVKPSNGHIGVARREAAASWGEASSVWPIGRSLHYAWPAARPDFWPLAEPDTASKGVKAYRVDTGLVQALQLGREVLFSTDAGTKRHPTSGAGSCVLGSAYIAIHADLDSEVWQALERGSV